MPRFGQTSTAKTKAYWDEPSARPVRVLKAGAHDIWEQAEETRLVQPGEEKAERQILLQSPSA